MTITKREFRNLLCIMHSIDSWELPDSWNGYQKARFIDTPILFFLRSDDQRMEEIWQIVMQRAMGTELEIDTPF
jgi:hypothetical protein